MFLCELRDQPSTEELQRPGKQSVGCFQTQEIHCNHYIEQSKCILILCSRHESVTGPCFFLMCQVLIFTHESVIMARA